MEITYAHNKVQAYLMTRAKIYVLYTQEGRIMRIVTDKQRLKKCKWQ